MKEQNLVTKCWKLFLFILHTIVYKILRLNLSEKAWNQFVQFIKFCLVGLSNTCISYILYLCGLTIFQKLKFFENSDYLIAQVIAFFLSVLWSFYWNRKYVFHKEGKTVSWFQALLKTYASYAFTGLFLATFLSMFWVEIVHIPKVIAPLFNLVISVPVNFLLNKFWAFRGQERKQTDSDCLK